MVTEKTGPEATPVVGLHQAGSDIPFYMILAVLGGTYTVLLIGLLVSDATYVVTSKANEIQRLTLTGSPNGGTFTLSFLHPNPKKQVSTQLSTTLESAEQATFEVADAAVLPAAPFIARLGDEQLRVIKIQENTLSATRGLNGTATAHRAGSRIVLTETTADIAYDATAAQLQVALETLPGLDVGTELTMNIDATAANCDVVDGSVFTTPPFIVRIDDEDLKVNQVSENRLSVTRGVNGTRVTEHNRGARVSLDVAVSGRRLPQKSLDIEFLGSLRYVDVAPLSVDTSRLVGDGEQGGVVTTQFDAALWGQLVWMRPILRPVLPMLAVMKQPEIRYSIKLTMISCLFTAILSLLVAVPIGYVLSRHRFPGRNILDAFLDIPIVLPPLVVGLCLLILFQFWPFNSISRFVVFQIPAVILSQFMVAAAFAVRIMRATFDQIDNRLENVALTLGCSQAQAFGMVILPQARNGMLTAGTLAWARSLGEFGPLLIFAGATRNKTEVLSTSVFLELSIGHLEGAASVSLLMIMAAILVLVIARVWGSRNLSL